MPEVMGLLKPKPKVRTVATELSEAKRHFRRHAGFLREDAIERLPADAERRCGGGHLEAECRQDVLAENLAGMNRWSRRAASHSILGHAVSSMILLEIDPAGLARVELEGDAPRPVDVNRETDGIEAAQCMEVEARHCQVLDTSSASSRRMIRLCSRGSIAAVLPREKRSARPLLRNVRITPRL